MISQTLNEAGTGDLVKKFAAAQQVNLRGSNFPRCESLDRQGVDICLHQGTKGRVDELVTLDGAPVSESR